MKAPSLVLLRCEHCREWFWRARAEVKYRRKAGIMRTFCGLPCSAASRRHDRDFKKATRAAYDAEYRARNKAMLKAKKAAYQARTYDPDKARAVRKSLGDYHARYLRERFKDPAYKAAKVKYDQERRDRILYGPLASAHRALVEIGNEVRRRIPDKYERLKARGYYNRPDAKQRRRDAQDPRANR